MICKKCGNVLKDGDQFCTNCGSPVVNETQTNPQVASTSINSTINGVNTANQGPMAFEQTTQPISPIEQTYAQPVSNPLPTNNSNKVGTNKTMIIAIIAGVVVIGLLILLFTIVIPAMGNTKETDATSNANTSNTTNTPTATQTSINYTMTHGNYTFSIPTDYSAQFIEDKFVILDKAETWAVSIEYLDVTYSSVTAMKSNLITAFEQNGMTISKVSEKTISNNKVLIFESTQNGENVMLGLMATPDNSKCYALTALTATNNFDLSIFENFVPILANAKYNALSNSITFDNSIDMSIIENTVK